jgi:Flp pilus assembly protein TadD
MKSLRTFLLAVLVCVPVAACGGGHDVSTSSGDEGGSGSKRLPVMAPEKTDPTQPVAIEDKGPSTVVKPDEPLAIPAKFEGAMALGRALAAKGDHSRAKEVFEAAAKIEKKNAEPHIELARLFIVMGERAPAIKSANKAIKLAPESSQAYNTLGRAELARFNYDNAIIAFTKATELNPDNVWAWNNLGFTHLQRKDYPEAVAALEIAVQKKDATGYMFNNLGTAYEHQDQLDEARAAFESGGKLGSAEALSSRKRLEGVDTLVVVKTATAETPKAPGGEKTYENAEPMPEDVADPVETVEEAVPSEPEKIEPVTEVHDVNDEPPQAPETI